MWKPFEDSANTIRGLAIDAIEAAGCGHPGLPLGCAELGAYLMGKGLTYHSEDPEWLGRDRFVLSAGHGSMLLYAMLHLGGYDISISDIKNFRQLHSKTPGHPELDLKYGVETTTGPLGQGVAMGIGMALSQKIIGSRTGLASTSFFNPKVVILAGDGCMMEGVSQEASSFAGHLGLDNVILIYDANDICLDGPISECFSDDVAARYESYGWAVKTLNGHDFSEIDAAYIWAKAQSKPTLLIAKTTIGKGAPSVEGTSEVHGKALGAELAAKAKSQIGLPSDQLFYVPDSVSAFFESRKKELKETYQVWQSQFKSYSSANPALMALVSSDQSKKDIEATVAAIEEAAIDGNKATRQLSQSVLQILGKTLPQVVGGSADLSCSDSTFIKSDGFVEKGNYSAKNVKYGVREFAMAAIANGMALQGELVPFVGTFFTFSDYMKNAIRLAALMNVKTIFQFTHDSVFLGEDGPTHQPVEHLAALRAMPNCNVIRPAGVAETKAAWISALKASGPTALVLSRQTIKEIPGTSIEGALKGAYIVSTDEGALDRVIISTGSELPLANDVATELRNKGLKVRLVSMPSFELFEAQPQSYRDQVLPSGVSTWSIEAQSSFGWHRYVTRDGGCISVDQFGLSAPASQIAEELGFTVPQITNRILK